MLKHTQQTTLTSFEAKLHVQGDLVVHIEVCWPEQLSDSQRMLLRAALFLPAVPSREQAAAVAAFDAAFRDGCHGWASRQPRQP
jgi:DnaJ-class molecular chaperone